MAAFWESLLDTLDGLQLLYAASMRGSMFTGFLTVCSFLLAAKTFLVTNLKSEVYGKEEYVDFYLQHSGQPLTDIHAPLRELSRQLMRNVTLAFVTCVSQFTVGLIPHWSATLVCLVLAVVTLASLIGTLLLMRTNLDAMFAWMDKSAEKKLEDRRKASGAKPPDRS